MATVQIAFFSPQNIGGTSVFPKTPRAAEKITSSGSSQLSAGTAQAGEYARVASSGGDICAAGAATVVSGGGYLVQSGSTEVIGPLSAGDKIALIDL